MTATPIPLDPKESRFGWPKAMRVEEIKSLLKQFEQSPSKATFRIEFQQKTQDLPILRVHQNLPRYRLENGRTASAQTEYLAKHTSKAKDLFTKDPELWEAQEAQHRMLVDLGAKADLRKTFEDPVRKQVEPIILDENGFVINGNRRLATWRELLHADPKKYGHFEYIDVVVLPHCDEKAIDRLEASLQIEQDIKADYTWDAEANMMLAKRAKEGYSNKELADLYGKKESEVAELLDMRAYAEEFLTSRGRADYWSSVSGKEFAFRKIVSSRQKVVGQGNQEIFKQAAFTLIDDNIDTVDGEASAGRLYAAIPAVVDCLDVVKDKLKAQFSIKTPKPDEDLDALFGGEVPAKDSDKVAAMLLAQEIQKPENAGKAREIIVEVVESQKQLKSDSASANYLLNVLSKAQALLAMAVKDGLRPESSMEGVPAQLEQIEAQLDKIHGYVAQQNKC
ncbi:hypothetical protein D9M68_165990 [compost metagenome]